MGAHFGNILPRTCPLKLCTDVSNFLDLRWGHLQLQECSG